MRFWGGGMCSIMPDIMNDTAKKYPLCTGHGMMLETSLMMATHPDLVDLPRAKRIKDYPLDSQLKNEPQEPDRPYRGGQRRMWQYATEHGRPAGGETGRRVACFSRQNIVSAKKWCLMKSGLNRWGGSCTAVPDFAGGTGVQLPSQREPANRSSCEKWPFREKNFPQQLAHGCVENPPSPLRVCRRHPALSDVEHAARGHVPRGHGRQ